MSAARYAATQNATEAPREIELRALRYVNGLLTAAGSSVVARAVALYKAHRLWSILIGDLMAPGNGLPAALRGQLASLGLWAQRECMARLTDAASLQPLITLHRDLIEGLQAQASVRPVLVPAQGLGAVSA